MSEEILVESKNDDIKGSSESEVQKRNFKDGLYGKINVSIDTMDKFIVVLLVALLASIIFGVII